LKLVGRVPLARLRGEPFVRLEYPPWHVLVALVDDLPVAIEDSCNHAGASLSLGPRVGDTVVCPMHGYVFSLTTGELIAPRGLCDAQRRLTAVVEGDFAVVWDSFQVDIAFG
jgi:nitrite reductase/ring-hydroxylating ferredoxin subunit